MKGGKAAENSFKSVIRVSESHMDLKPWSGMPSVLRPITTKDNHPLLLATCQSSLLHKRSTPVGPNQPSRPCRCAGDQTSQGRLRICSCCPGNEAAWKG